MFYKIRKMKKALPDSMATIWIKVAQDLDLFFYKDWDTDPDFLKFDSTWMAYEGMLSEGYCDDESTSSEAAAVRDVQVEPYKPDDARTTKVRAGVNPTRYSGLLQ